MKNIIAIFIILLLSLSQSIKAQLIVRDQEPIPNPLLLIEDEGTSGSIILPPLPAVPGDVDQKLYNVSGELFWNGNKVGTSFTAAGWTYDGTNILTSTLNDKVGIGTTTAPSVKLSLGMDIEPKKLALFDGPGNFYGFGMDANRITIFTDNSEKMTIEDNGNVGIGTNNPDAKLDVNGDVKIGSNGIKISEIYELTGTTTCTPTAWFVEVPFPSGYTQENTRVLSLEAVRFGEWQGYGPGSIEYFINNWNIKIATPFGDTSWCNKPFRMVIMKIE